MPFFLISSSWLATAAPPATRDIAATTTPASKKAAVRFIGRLHGSTVTHGQLSRATATTLSRTCRTQMLDLGSTGGPAGPTISCAALVRCNSDEPKLPHRCPAHDPRSGTLLGSTSTGALSAPWSALRIAPCRPRAHKSAVPDLSIDKALVDSLATLASGPSRRVLDGRSPTNATS